MSAIANDTSISTEYTKLSKRYDAYYQQDNFQAAFRVSLEQLKMDPSDAVALMRLALVVDGSCDFVEPHFARFGSMDRFKEITLLAQQVIAKECRLNS
ncbi:hypothetical protein [Vibrio sp. 10N]|uniref:hypothetical protein n=1 Tax=Vibrio sp. 10N TaxID=3058938 RepID=UPI002813254D|nr:hypothetical protein VB10N_43260 [Vibrio sp. 10N]